MSYTIEQLFTRACSLVDSLKTDGTVGTSTTSDYRSRTLTLVDLTLKKLNVVADYYKIFEFDITDEDDSPWTKVELPVDVKDITKVVLSVDDSYSPISNYQIEYVGSRISIYLQFDVDGKVRVQYKSISTVPTAFTDIVEIDDTCAAAVCYDLARNYVATEQNFELAKFFREDYNEIKSTAKKKQPEGEVKIIDYYGGI